MYREMLKYQQDKDYYDSVNADLQKDLVKKQEIEQQKKRQEELDALEKLKSEIKEAEDLERIPKPTIEELRELRIRALSK